MSENSIAFRKQFQPTEYPEAFLQKYTVIKCLAASSQGETLLVLDKASGLTALAKVMPSGQEDREAELLQTLSHPALPKLMDTYECGDMRLHIREYVHGVALDNAMRDNVFTEREVSSIIAQLCDVLSYLHSQTPPVIHRDIKPSNLILCENCRLMLIDFGISRKYDPSVQQDTFVSGTDRYAPPEQYGFKQTDARADIYSTGMVMRFLLTNGDWQKRVHNRALRRIVARCTRFSPEERWPSALALKRALRAYPGRIWRQLAAAALAAALLAVGVTAGGPYLQRLLSPGPAPVVWVEPSIESAVRLALDKPEGELSREELARVTELYLVQDTPAKDLFGFYELVGDYYAGRRSQEPGSVNLLDDLAMLPNLRKLALVCGQIQDIGQLAPLSKLEWLEMKHNQVSDLSPLAGLKQLQYVGFTGNPVADISPLTQLPSLAEIDLTFGAVGADMSPIAEMGDFTSLSLSGCERSYEYVNSKRIGTLVLSYSEMDSLKYIDTVTGLTKLDIGHTRVTDLRGIEAHSGLTELTIVGDAIEDLSPLYNLRYLTRLTVSQGTQVDTSLFNGYNDLAVSYQ